MSFKILAFENTSVDNLASFDPEAVAFSGTRLGIGVVATQTAEIESVDAVHARVRRAAAFIDASQLWIVPDCGLRHLPREAARDKLTRLVTAVQDARAAL
jgi:5-methyltetrahydropteroyltriglutamate--homocysteine methyltransferase